MKPHLAQPANEFMSERTARKRIGVAPAHEFESYQRLFHVLSSLFPVEFHKSEHDFGKGLDALILLAADRETAVRAAAAGIRCFAVLGTGEPPVRTGSVNVDFGAASNLHVHFAGQTLAEGDIEEFAPLSLQAGDEIVASMAGRVLWIHRSEGRSGVDLLATGPRELAEGEYLCEHLQAGRFMRLMPLIHFLREVTKDIDWTAPPLRACLVIDDPNMHGSSYGYIDYKDLVHHAGVHNYHASLAMIPFDAWHVRPGTARLFRENPSRISLLIHGNNHTAKELACPGPDAYKLAILAQALRRIETFERKWGLKVSRVMSAPHSACSEDMLHFMLQLGYEAACVPWDSLFRFNPRHPWSSTTGMNVADFHGCGLPIITRIRLQPDWSPRLKSYPDWKAGLILSAFLGQPVVPTGHHHDAADGMEFLAEVAKTVNRLGNVMWMDMKGIMRSNYMTRSEGKLLRIKMCSRRISLKVPGDVVRLSVERPWIAEDGEKEMLLCKRAGKETVKLTAGPVTASIPVRPLESIELTTVPRTRVHYSELRSPPFSLWPLARRFMTEGRDKMLPLFKRKRSQVTRRRRNP